MLPSVSLGLPCDGLLGRVTGRRQAVDEAPLGCCLSAGRRVGKVLGQPIQECRREPLPGDVPAESPKGAPVADRHPSPSA